MVTILRGPCPGTPDVSGRPRNRAWPRTQKQSDILHPPYPRAQTPAGTAAGPLLEIWAASGRRSSSPADQMHLPSARRRQHLQGVDRELPALRVGQRVERRSSSCRSGRPAPRRCWRSSAICPGRQLARVVDAVGEEQDRALVVASLQHLAGRGGHGVEERGLPRCLEVVRARAAARAGSAEKSSTSRTSPSEKANRAKSSPDLCGPDDRLRIAFLAFSSLLATPMLPEVSTRNAKDTGAVSSRSKVSNVDARVARRAATKSSLRQAVGELAALVGDEDRQHDVFGARALREGRRGSSARLGVAWRPRPAAETRSSGRARRSVSPTNYKARGPPRHSPERPGPHYTVAPCEPLRIPRPRPRAPAEHLEPRLGGPGGAKNFGIRRLSGRRARGAARRGVFAPGFRRRRPARLDRALCRACRRPWRTIPVVVTTSSLRARGRTRDLGSRRAAGISRGDGLGVRGVRLRAGTERPDRGRARARLGVPAPADRARFSDDERLARGRRRSRGRARRSHRIAPTHRPRSPSPPAGRDRGGARATGTAPSRRSTSTTPGTATVRCATGEGSSPAGRSRRGRSRSCEASRTGSWWRCASRRRTRAS